MKISKERKVLLILFGLGLVGLGIDRAFFAPSEAAAAPTPAPEPSTPGQVTSAPAPVPAASGPSFATRLADKKAVWTPGGRDAFEAPSAWVGSRGAEQAEQVQEDQSAFAKSHKLSFVWSRVNKHTGKPEVLAVMDGGTYRVDDVVDGYRIKELHAGPADDQWALFEGQGEVVKLRVIPPKGVKRHATDKQAVGERESTLRRPPAPPGAENPAPSPPDR